MLVRRIYRSLFRITTKLDKKSVLKSFIAADRGEYYDRIETKWVPLDNVRDANDEVATALRVLAKVHCSGGMFWLPNSTKFSLSQMLSHHFREKTSSVGTLNQQQRLDLAFSVFRYLSRCSRLGTLLTKVDDDLESLSAEVESNGGDELFSSTALEPGSILIAHPMLYQNPLTQSILLIVSHSVEEGTLGLVVNSPMNCLLGAKVSPDTLRDFPYLTVFAECELYQGGDVISPQPLALIHQVDSLSHCSQKILSVEPSCNSNANVDQSKDATDNENALNQNSNSGALYYTQDIKVIAEEILAGRARAEDFKCIIGCALWGKGQLQGELDMNSWFLAKGAAAKEVSLLKVRISPSLDLEAQEERWGQEIQEELRKSAMDQEGEELQDTFKIIENLEYLSERESVLSGEEQTVVKIEVETLRTDSNRSDIKDAPPLSYMTSSDGARPLYDWSYGHRTWQKVLRKIGGDYAPLADTSDLTVWLDKTAWKDLTALSLYGVDDKDNI